VFNKLFLLLFIFLTLTTSVFSDPKLKVVVSFNAMREFASVVGKDLVEIKTIIPDGVEPHDYEPKASDLLSLNDARIFIYNGLGMESWVDKSLKAVNNKNLIVVDASRSSTPVKNTNPNEIKEHGQFDPHLWLSLKGAEIEGKNILDALVKADPANNDKYNKNYFDYLGQIEVLYNDYKSKFRSVKNKNFVTGHAAFGYFSRDFGLIQNSVEDVFAEGEPSAKRLAELIDFCKKNSIKTIFVEDMVSPKVSESLANEAGATTEKIYTLESREKNKDYLQCMKENMEKIYNSLK
jgi:zinc transport system substrate-binding protein